MDKAAKLIGHLMHEGASRKKAIPKRQVMTQHGPMFVPLSAFEKGAEAKPTGMFKGNPMSPDGKKFTLEFQGIPIHIDRPKGFIMTGEKDGKPWKRQYKYNYGYIPRTKGGDGDQLDVFLGPKRRSQSAFWAIQTKDDGSFDEYKVFLGFENRDEATAAYRAHIPKKLLKGMVTMRVDMMKSMLGIGPTGIQKVAGLAMVSFMDESAKIADLQIPPELAGVAQRLTRKGVVHELAEAAKQETGELKDKIKEVTKALTPG
jgi:hypothetical protein